MQLIRSSLFFISYFCATISYGTLSLFTWVLPLRTRHKIIISWTHVIIFLVKVICGVKYKITGQEYIDAMRNQPVVVLSKHQSTWETLFLQGAFWPASTILKKELLRIPFFGWGLRGLYPIAIDRSNPKLALRQVKEEGALHLKQGFNIIIFPEGTRMELDQRGKYARSGADIAVSSEAKIIPVAVNSGVCWPANQSFLKYPGTINVVIGEPIETTGKNSKAITAEVEEWIESKMAQLPRTLSGQKKTN